MNAWIETLNLLGRVWFDSFYRASIEGGVFLLAVWGICRIHPHMPFQIRYFLWCLAYLKFFVALAWLNPI